MNVIGSPFRAMMRRVPPRSLHPAKIGVAL
jgi:hypothetical protein